MTTQTLNKETTELNFGWKSLKQKTITPALVNEHFRTVYRDQASDYPNYTDYLNRHLLFVTITFFAGNVAAHGKVGIDRDGMPYGQPSALSEFGRFYFNVSRKLCGKHLERKRLYQPLTYAWTDFKDSDKMTTLKAVDRQMPHIHGLMLVRPQHLAEFAEIDFRHPHISPLTMSDVQIQKFDASKRSVEILAGYCMKGVVKSHDDPYSEDLWGLFPR